MPEHVLGIDEGSTGVRAYVFDGQGVSVGTAYQEIARNHPQPGWCEHDPVAIVNSTVKVARLATERAGLQPSDLRALGVATQRATCLVWERATGRPLYPAIGWQDLRTTATCEELGRRGLLINPMMSASKFKWILDHTDCRRRAPGELCFGTLDSWIVWNLTGGAHVTDHSNASCTGLYDFFANAWDTAILEILGLSQDSLPKMVETSHVVAETQRSALGAAIPVGALAGDQQAAMFGQLCFHPGSIKASYGTSAMVDLNVGDRFLLSPHGAYPLVLWKIAGAIAYCLEGTAITAGAVLQWLRDNLGMVSDVAEIDRLAASVPDSAGVWCLPAFQGLGTPYLDPRARAHIGGISLATTRAHIARAILESIALRCRQVIEALKADVTDAETTFLRVDGGAARSDVLMQLQADLLGVAVERPEILDAGALGAAYLAGLATGAWKSRDELDSVWRRERLFEPKIGEAEREERYRRWLESVQAGRPPAG